MCARQIRASEPEHGDEGFMLLTAVVMIFIVLLVLSVAAPRMAREIQRDRELESKHRAEQYVRAIRIFYNKFHRYPGSIEQLEKTNNQRFLRQKYDDPLTGKPDWRLIHLGENQTTVKGFFGEDLPGLPGGLGSASSMASSTGGSAGGSTPSAFGSGASSPSAFGSPGGTTLGGGAAAGGLGASNGTTGSATAGGTGTTGTNGTSNSPGVASQDATSFNGGGGAPIIGVGSAKSGEAMLVVNEQTTYDTWEFLYDPRIEQLYAKSTLLGGIPTTNGSGSGTGLGTGTSNGFGTPIGTPIGTSPTTPAGNTGTPPTVGVPNQP